MAMDIVAIIFTLAYLTVASFVIFDTSYDLVDFVLCGILSLLIAAAVFVASIFALNGIMNLIVDHEDHYERVQLVAIQDGAGTHGEYFLGIGSTDSTPQYTFYTQNGAAKQLQSVEAVDVVVYEDSNEPYLVKFVGCTLSVSWLAECIHDGDQVNEIHVPAGSIRSGVALDAN